MNGGSHISSVLIFYDISPHCCLQIICHPPFYALRLLIRSNANSFVAFSDTRCTAKKQKDKHLIILRDRKSFGIDI